MYIYVQNLESDIFNEFQWGVVCIRGPHGGQVAFFALTVASKLRGWNSLSLVNNVPWNLVGC